DRRDHSLPRVGPFRPAAETAQDERAIATDGDNARIGNLQPRTPHLYRTQARGHRTVVWKALKQLGAAVPSPNLSSFFQIDYHHAPEGQCATDNAKQGRQLAQPYKSDQGCDRRDQIKEVGGSRRRQPRQRHGPCAVGNRAWYDAQVADGPYVRTVGDTCLRKSFGKKGRQAVRAKYHVLGCNRQLDVIGKKRHLHDGRYSSADHSAKDHQDYGIKTQAFALAQRDNADTREGDKGSKPCPAGKALAEQGHCHDGGEDRADIDDEGCSTSRYRLLAHVEQCSVERNKNDAPKDKAPGFRPLRQSRTPDRQPDRRRDGRYGKAERSELQRPERMQAGADGRKGGRRPASGTGATDRRPAAPAPRPARRGRCVQRTGAA